jgi:hypothetical protein
MKLIRYESASERFGLTLGHCRNTQLARWFYHREYTDNGQCVMGRRQVARHRVLVPAFGGSNPPAPAMQIMKFLYKNI